MSGTSTPDHSRRGGGVVQPETWADAEVEIVNERDRSQGQTGTTEATDKKAADATGSSARDVFVQGAHPLSYHEDDFP